ncbi:MAG: sensor histidine kinase [Eubacterium sp.]|nr:sensor histidine kinase [Eubacterium sp.]
MKRLYHSFFHDLNLKIKFIIVNLILVLVPTIILASVLYSNLSSIIRDTALKSEAALVVQTSETISETVNRLNATMENVSSNNMFTTTLYTTDMAGYLKNMKSNADSTSFFAFVQSMIDGDLVTAIRLYFPDNENTGISEDFFSENYPDNGILGLESEITSAYWHGIFDGAPQTEKLLCPEFYLTNKEIYSYGDTACIRKFTNKTAGEQIYVAVYVSRNYLDEVLKHTLSGTGSVYYIINERNALVASSDLQLSGMYMMRYEDVPKRISGEGTFAVGTISGNDVYMSYKDIPDTGWRLVSVIPTGNVTEKGTAVLLRTLYLYIFFMVLAVLLAIALSGNIAGRLSKLVRRMSEQKGKLTPEKINDEKGKDEIGQLVEHYNIMIDRINTLAEEQAVIADKLKVSEVNALQAQINPHFLYNMLDMIKWLSRSGKTEETAKAIQALSNFYKLTLSKKEIFTTVEEELRHVKLYTDLQNMRYENKIDLLIDVPEELYEVKIPKLVFQPIVENAILHGLFEREEKSGSIVITGWAEGNEIVFSISDTGVGIGREDLMLILEGKLKGSGSNIGISNTHQRLQFIYGENCGLHYESEKGVGTEVTVRIRRQPENGKSL